MRKKAVVRPMYNNHVETEQDILTCGDCQREFILGDIVKFVQHKVNRCNCSKDKCQSFDDQDFHDDEENEETAGSATVTPTVIGNKRPSISAPIALKGNSGEVLRDRLSPSLTGDLEEGEVIRLDNCGGGESGYRHQGAVSRGSRVLDAAVNTDTSESSSFSEPFNFVCHTCKSIYKTSWFLVQHVQSVHGIKIYSEHSVDPEVFDQGNKDQSSQHKHMRHSIPSLLGDHSHKTPPVGSEGATDTVTEQRQAHTQSTSSVASSVSSASTAHSRTPTHQRSPNDSSPVSASDMFMHPPPSFPFSRGQHSIPHSAAVTAAAAAAAVFHHGQFPRPPMAGDLPLISPEMLSELPFRRLGPFPPLPPGLEHALPGFPFRPNSMTETSMLDFYSQRLKRLALNPASPLHQARRAISQAHAPNYPITPPTSQAHEVVSNNGSESPEKPVLPPKTKPCEFCGKCFRFHSNLIVHRRVHTGEKPYRCMLCPHTCSQASKLKKHMKIHIKSHLAAAGINLPSSVHSSENGDSNNSSPAKNEDGSFVVEDHDDSDEDFDDLEEEEAAAREAQAEAEVRQFAEQVRLNQKETEGKRKREDEDGEDEVETAKVKEEPVDLACEGKEGNKENGEVDRQKGTESPKDLSLSKEQKLAVLNEVMANSGLANIEQYEQAYKQAVAESSRKESEEDTSSPINVYPRPPASASSIASSTSNQSGDFGSSHLYENGLPSSEPSTPTSNKAVNNNNRDLSPEPAAKRVKPEPAEGATAMSSSNPFTPSIEQMYQREALYPSGVWFPQGSPRDLFPTFRNEQMLQQIQENGMSHSRGGGALKLSSPDGIPSMHSVSPSMGGGTTPTHIPGVPFKKRNDTCEFCGKVFKNCSNLTVHRRSHTGEKPYKCALCSYACAQSSKLTRHMKTHGRLGKDVYRCKFCNMPFSVASTLEKHMRKCVESQQHHRGSLHLAERSLSVGDRPLSALSDRSMPELGERPMGMADSAIAERMMSLRSHDHDHMMHSSPPGSSIGSTSPAVSTATY